MHIQRLLLTAILGLIPLAGADSLEKWTEIAAKSRSNVIRLNEQTFDQLVAAERNYTAISPPPVTLTALTAQHQCALCREFDPGFSLVAESWRKAHPQSDGVFFAKIDFAEARAIFVRFGIQSAPNVWVYPPTSGPRSKLSSNNQPIIYDFTGNGMQPEPFHKFLQSNIQLPPFPIVRPFNWQKLFMTVTTIALTGLIATLAGPQVWPQIRGIITDKTVWTLGCIMFILMFTSGYMFNAIRHTPFTQPNGRGGFNYIAGGFQSQLGVETQIVATIYGVLALATIALLRKAPAIRDPRSQLVVVMIWSAGIMCIYSFLIYVFRMKNGGYPFRLFL